MANTCHYLVFLALCTLCLCDSSEYLKESALATKLHYIESLQNYCEESICRGFDFKQIDDVAVFDIKEEIRISEDATTYDIKSPLAANGLLVFENSTFAHFPLRLFKALDVRELDMRNCSVQILTWENFLMAGNLRVLLLSHNEIESIETSTFTHALNLQYLFLDYNRIETLLNKSFQGSQNLSYLNLQHNRLMELPIGVFADLAALQELNLADNRLRYLHNDLFTNNTRLQSIMLSGNRLTQIDDNIFKAQPQLLLLDLSHNAHLQTLVLSLNEVRNLIAANCSLNRVDIYGSAINVDMRDNQILELYFSKPETLQHLNMRNNKLQQIASLARVINLRQLVLADNPDLGGLPNPWQANALERLDISNISAHNIPIDLLAEHSNLRVLNISHNKFQQINPLFFKYFEKLNNFYIHGNDWNCNNLRLLMDLLIRVNAITYTPDKFYANFSGEYIDGIACMLRSEEQVDIPTLTPSETAANYVAAESDKSTTDATNEEVHNLRKELKAIVGIYEQIFDKVFEEIQDLRARLEKFERFNETMWKHITVMV